MRLTTTFVGFRLSKEKLFAELFWLAIIELNWKLKIGDLFLALNAVLLSSLKFFLAHNNLIISFKILNNLQLNILL